MKHKIKFADWDGSVTPSSIINWDVDKRRVVEDRLNIHGLSMSPSRDCDMCGGSFPAFNPIDTNKSKSSIHLISNYKPECACGQIAHAYCKVENHDSIYRCTSCQTKLKSLVDSCGLGRFPSVHSWIKVLQSQQLRENVLSLDIHELAFDFINKKFGISPNDYPMIYDDDLPDNKYIEAQIEKLETLFELKMRQIVGSNSKFSKVSKYMQEKHIKKLRVNLTFIMDQFLSSQWMFTPPLSTKQSSLTSEHSPTPQSTPMAQRLSGFSLDDLAPPRSPAPQPQRTQSEPVLRGNRFTTPVNYKKYVDYETLCGRTPKPYEPQPPYAPTTPDKLDESNDDEYSLSILDEIV